MVVQSTCVCSLRCSSVNVTASFSLPLLITEIHKNIYAQFQCVIQYLIGISQNNVEQQLLGMNILQDLQLSCLLQCMVKARHSNFLKFTSQDSRTSENCVHTNKRYCYRAKCIQLLLVKTNIQYCYWTNIFLPVMA